MKLISWFKLNIRIIQTYNSCNMSTFSKLVEDLLDADNQRAFSSKRYIWNVIRPKDYYKCMADIVVKYIESIIKGSYDDSAEYCMSRAEFILNVVTKTAKTDAIRKNFVWNITKRVPLLTLVTIQYSSEDRIINILKSNKPIITDESLAPFMKEIKSLHNEIKELQDEADLYKTIVDE